MANISHANLASSKLPNRLDDHVVVTIPFNHATKEGSIFFIGSLDKNSDCISTIMPEHATLKKTAHSLRSR